jgi:hypothetical protein
VSVVVLRTKLNFDAINILLMRVTGVSIDDSNGVVKGCMHVQSEEIPEAMQHWKPIRVSGATSHETVGSDCTICPMRSRLFDRQNDITRQHLLSREGLKCNADRLLPYRCLLVRGGH